MSRRLPLYGERGGDGPRVASPAAQAHAPEWRVFRSSRGAHLFVVEGSRIFDIDEDSASALEGLDAGGRGPEGRPPHEAELLSALRGAAGRRGRFFIDGRPAAPPPLRSISLNVAQACNMSCRYCYADEGKFGGGARMMTAEVALASVDRLVEESEPGAGLVVGFMGGEPLLNRAVIHDATRYAERRAREAGKSVRFSLTTNGTLLRREDVELFSSHPYTVQLSVDGGKSLNDSLRPTKDGTSSFDKVAEAVRLFDRFGRPRHLAARVTVTPLSGELLPILDGLIGAGFDDVGFAPVLVSPSAEYAFGPDSVPRFLELMVECGRKCLGEWLAGRAYPFSNLMTAMQELHRGTSRPYPCGAGAAYLSADTEGALFACHRLVGDAEFAMGHARDGTDLEARARHLRRSHVDLMEPCRTCWARYLCGGGCYHEVSRRGRVSCDYIRGWLEFCLGAYAELSSALPGCPVFGAGEGAAGLARPNIL